MLLPDTIFLDRDGVINQDSPHYIKKPVEEFHPLPGSIEAIVRLSRAAVRVIVITNQSAINRGNDLPGRAPGDPPVSCVRGGVGTGRPNQRYSFLPPSPRRRLRLPQTKAGPDPDRLRSAMASIYRPFDHGRRQCQGHSGRHMPPAAAAPFSSGPAMRQSALAST